MGTGVMKMYRRNIDDLKQEYMVPSLLPLTRCMKIAAYTWRENAFFCTDVSAENQEAELRLTRLQP